MAVARITCALPPDIDVTKAPLAFGTRGIPKLNEEMQGSCLITRQRALMTLCDLTHNPERIYEAIFAGCIESLKNLLLDDDNTVRCKATEVLSIAASHDIGRNALLDYGVIVPLSIMFDDPVEVVRKNSHEAISRVSSILQGATGIVEANLVWKLCRKLGGEWVAIQLLMLDTLHNCARVNPHRCLIAGIIGELKPLLSHAEDTIRAGAARVLMDVTVPLEGKNAACDDSEVVPKLVEMLGQVNEHVKANAAGALMTIAITTRGKYAALKHQAVPPLLNLISAKSTETKLNAIKALTCVAEASEGRKALLNYVSEFEDRKYDIESKAVARAAEIALKVITWKP